MVAGDLVNTASRLQSVAAPGHGPRRRGDPARRVGGDRLRAGRRADAQGQGGARAGLAGAAGRRRARRPRPAPRRLEAPFVGRDDELRLLKDLFHATSRERRARLVSVIGPAGIGKTPPRLGVPQVRRRPRRGRLVARRARPRLRRRHQLLGARRDGPRPGRPARDRRRARRPGPRSPRRSREHVPDEDERRWIEPALLALLGVETARSAAGAALRRLADVLRAARRDGARRAGLRGLPLRRPRPARLRRPPRSSGAGTVPIYVVTLARPELLERRPDWGAGKRNFTSLYLEPLPEPAMRELLAGLVPGLPEAAVRRDRRARRRHAALRRRDGPDARSPRAGSRSTDGVYRPIGDLHDLAVPETLTALIASPPRRAARRTTGRSSTTPPSSARASPLAGLAAVSGVDRGRARAAPARPRPPRAPHPRGRPALARSAASTPSSRPSSARSPTTRSRSRDRKARHLAAARFFESLGTDELAGALAGHYLAAHANASGGPEADALAAQARVALRAAAERAAALGSHEQAVAFLEQALTVTSRSRPRRPSCSSGPASPPRRPRTTTRPRRSCAAAVDAAPRAGRPGGHRPGDGRPRRGPSSRLPDRAGPGGPRAGGRRVRRPRRRSGAPRAPRPARPGLHAARGAARAIEVADRCSRRPSGPTSSASSPTRWSPRARRSATSAGATRGIAAIEAGLHLAERRGLARDCAPGARVNLGALLLRRRPARRHSRIPSGGLAEARAWASGRQR